MKAQSEFLQVLVVPRGAVVGMPSSEPRAAWVCRGYHL